MKFHLAFGLLVIAANVIMDITKTDWLITLVLIGVTWMAEVFNTAIEKLADRITTEKDILIGKVKDLASGAVLVLCIFDFLCE